MFTNTPPHRVAWLVTGPRRPHPVFNARNPQNSPTRFREEAEKKGERKARERIRWLTETHDASLAERTVYVHHPAYWSRRKREAEETYRQELRGEHLRSDLPLLQRARERA